MKQRLKSAWHFLVYPVRQLLTIRVLQIINLSLSKGILARTSLQINPVDPTSWEFSAFSQNGEDGIIEYLVSYLHDPNRYLVEFGTSDGLQNNTTWLVITQSFSGMLVDADRRSIHRLSTLFGALKNPRVEIVEQFITLESMSSLMKSCVHRNPDVFSLDIDGNDYYIARWLLENRYRPKIWIVEYNAVFGPEKSVTIPYNSDFNCSLAHPSRLYYGASIMAWQHLFSKYGYSFVTVESNGINAFFIDISAFEEGINLPAIKSRAYCENTVQRHHFHKGWTELYRIIEDMPVVEIL